MTYCAASWSGVTIGAEWPPYWGSKKVMASCRLEGLNWARKTIVGSPLLDDRYDLEGGLYLERIAVSQVPKRLSEHRQLHQMYQDHYVQLHRDYLACGLKLVDQQNLQGYNVPSWSGLPPKSLWSAWAWGSETSHANQSTVSWMIQTKSYKLNIKSEYTTVQTAHQIIHDTTNQEKINSPCECVRRSHILASLRPEEGDPGSPFTHNE